MALPLRHRHSHALALAFLTACLLGAAQPAHSDDAIERRLRHVLAGIESHEISSGVLLDRVISLSGLERFDGAPGAPAAGLSTWRQAVDELRRASAGAAALPDREALRARERAAMRDDLVPLSLLIARYERLRPDALESGAVAIQGDRLVRGVGPAFESRQAWLAAALRPKTYRGGAVEFVIRAGDVLGIDARAIAAIEADFADGAGFRPVRVDERVLVRYRAVGARELVLRIRLASGESREARAAFVVAALQAPLPDATLPIVASVAYADSVGTGSAYVRLAPGHSGITNPVVVVEGFDLDNSLGWDALYELLNQQGLVETLRTRGYDLVVLDFTEATAPVVRNAFVVSELIAQVQAAIPAQSSLALVGASMGGLCSRYALAWMESQAIPHRVRTWISYDAPHLGAVIPLGLQYWTNFFTEQSADAEFLRDRLNRPAAREMLVHHFTTPPSASALPDPLRAAMLAEFAAVGDWPALTRRVGFANGSGTGASQGFAPAAQLIRYEYSNFLVTLRGNVWAVPNQVSGQIFSGRIRIFLDDTQQNVTVSGTRPYDGAPGGWRATMTQMDTTEVPYGDIVALHPAHCFVPVTSAIAVDASDLFEPLAADPLLLDRTPFDAVWLAPSNQGHVTIDAATAEAIVDEIDSPQVDAPGPGIAGGFQLLPARPNPFVATTRIAFRLERAADAELRVIGVDGRAIATLAHGRFEAGPHDIPWDGRDDRGVRVPSGLYFVALDAGGVRATGRLVHLR